MKQYKHKITGDIATELKNYNVTFYNSIKFGVINGQLIEQSLDWELVKEEYNLDYQILSFIGTKENNFIANIQLDGKYSLGDINLYDIGFCTVEEMLKIKNKNYVIQSVKRLSDGEVFTLGDKCTKGEIIEINLSRVNTEIYLNTTSYIGMPLNKWKKVKQSLFTTKDGIEIFEGDSYYYVDNEYFIFFKTEKAISTSGKMGFEYFSTKEKAEEYIINNKPIFSLKYIKDHYRGVNFIQNITQSARKILKFK